MGILDLFNNVVNTASNAVNSALGNNHPVSQAVKQTANNFTNVSNTVKNVVNSNPVTQNAAKVLTSLNPLGAAVNAYKGVTSVLNNAGIPTPANALVSGNYNINYYARDKTGSQQSVTAKNTKTGQVDAIAIGGGNFADYYTADGTLKTQNYYKAESEADKLAAGYEYYKGSLRSPAEMQTIRNSGNFDKSQYEGTNAKYTQYLSKPTDFGKFVSSGGLNVLNNEKAQTAGYVYDSVSHSTPYENIRLSLSQSGAKTVRTGTTGTTGTPTKTNTNGLSALIDKMDANRAATYQNFLPSIASGDGGGITTGIITTAADVMLPLDLVSVSNKILTGRANEITAEQGLWAAADLISTIAIPFTFGGSRAIFGVAKGVTKAARIGSVAAPVTAGAGSVGFGIMEGLA